MVNIAYVSADVSLQADGYPPIPGGAGWVRVHQPARLLAYKGEHTVSVGTAVAQHPKGWLLPLTQEHKPLMYRPDIVIIQRWMHVDAADRTREARATGQVVIHDVDDWFWGLDPANRAYAATDPKRHKVQNRDHYKRAVEAADAVTVSTEFLARRIRERMGVRTILLRNAVDRATFTTAEVRDTGRGLVVGWTGALAWRSGDLETMREVLPRWLADNDATFVHHGTFPQDRGDTADKRIGLAPAQVGPSKPVKVPWLYPENLTGFDIGIVPLAKVEFNEAKSWIKGLEYAAAGIPFVAQDTPEYRALGCGLLADTPEQWRAALDRLRDPAVRLEQQALGLAVASDHDLNTRWTDWQDVYLGLLAARETVDA